MNWILLGLELAGIWLLVSLLFGVAWALIGQAFSDRRRDGS